MISWVQAALLGLMSCCAASTIACLGTTVGNYTLNRPLIASVFVGLILGDVKGCIQIAIPMQIIYIAGNSRWYRSSGFTCRFLHWYPSGLGSCKISGS